MSTNFAHRRETMSRLVIRALAPIALLVMAAGPALGGSEERKGTGGALELRIPVGPRGTALGGAVTSDASGTEAIYWNPAGLATLERPEVMFTHTNFFAEQDVNYAAVGFTAGGLGVLGLNVKALSIGDIIVTT